MSDILAQIESRRIRAERAEATVERVRDLCDKWHRWLLLTDFGAGVLSVPLPDVVDDLNRALDGEASPAARERQCGARHPSNGSVIPCTLDKGHYGDHESSTGCAGSRMTWQTAESQVALGSALDGDAT